MTNGAGRLVPTFGKKEMDMGSVIGTGGFSVVHEIYGMALDEIYDADDVELAAARLELATDADERRTIHGHPPYVLKTLRNDLSEEEHTKGVMDLAIEAEFLGELSHVHILPLVGMAHGDPMRPNFFVLLPRLAVTLERKFNYWRRVVGENAGVYVPVWGYCCSKTAALQELWKERHTVMRSVAAAMAHLHTHGIMYRDLKPDNIGFDDADVVKLFDFGLAKRWKTAELAPDQHNYYLTGQTGSLRYMAPEVAMEQPYNESVDVYSWGILYWQVCSLTTPFSKYSARQHADKVVYGGQRPTPEKSWPVAWRALMQDAWQSTPALRPTMPEVLQEITKFCQALGDDEIIGGDVENGGGTGGLVLTESTSASAGKIRAKTKKKRTADAHMDVDSRLQNGAQMHIPTAALQVGNEGTTEGSDLV